MVGRPREGIVLLRGAHQLALANDLRDLELQARVLMTFFEQWGEPAAGLALAREGLEIGQRLGSRAYGFQMVGNASICALRTGDWDWAATLLDEWLAIDTVVTQQAEFFVDRAILRTLRGRGRDGRRRGGDAGSASRAGSPTRSGSRTSCGRALGGTSSGAVTTRPRRLGSAPSS